MITPSFGLTATERVLPRLALDFTTASLDSRITFTRALNTATRVNSSGLIESVNADVARFDYNPITLACKGLLVEESRINLCTYSEDYANAAYGYTDITVNSDQTPSPISGSDADLLTQGTAGTATSLRASGITVSAGATITFSVFAKRSANMQWLRIRASNNANTNGGQAWFDLLNGVLGTVSNAGTGTNTSAKMEPYANGFYRLSVTTTIGAGDTVINRYIYSTTADSGTTRQSNAAYYLIGEQYEQNAFPTSYIPTTTTALTRNADVATMTGTNFSSWFTDPGTAVIEWDIPYSVVGNRGPLWFNAGVNGRGIGINYQSAGATAGIYRDAAGLQYQTAGRAPEYPKTRAVFGFSNTAIAYAANGSSTVSNTSATVSVATIDRVQLGACFVAGSNTGYISGVLREFLFYPYKLTNAEVQAFSKKES